MRLKIKREGFEHVAYTECSKIPRTFPDAVKFAARRGTVLPSVAEAVVFNMEHPSEYEENSKKARKELGGLECEITRTVVVGFKQGSEFLLAFDDVVEGNPLLERYAEANYPWNEHYRGPFGTGKLLLPVSDVSGILKRAYTGGSERIMDAEAIEHPILSLRNPRDRAEYSRIVRPILGDVSEDYALFLRKTVAGTLLAKEFKKELMAAGVDKDHVLVGSVSISLANCSCIVAYCQLCSGFVRVVKYS